LKDAVAGVVVTVFAVTVVVAAFSVALALAVITTPVLVTADAMEVKVTGLGDWRLASDLDSEGTTIVTTETVETGGASGVVTSSQLVTVVTGAHTGMTELGKMVVGTPCRDARISARRPGWITSRCAPRSRISESLSAVRHRCRAASRFWRNTRTGRS
jgi:hypothetical protein